MSGSHSTTFYILQSKIRSRCRRFCMHTHTHSLSHTYICSNAYLSSYRKSPSFSPAGKTRLDPWFNQSIASSCIGSYTRMLSMWVIDLQMRRSKSFRGSFQVKSRRKPLWMLIMGSWNLSPGSWIVAFGPSISYLILAIDDEHNITPLRVAPLRFQVLWRIFIYFNPTQNQASYTTPRLNRELSSFAFKASGWTSSFPQQSLPNCPWNQKEKSDREILD